MSFLQVPHKQFEMELAIGADIRLNLLNGLS